MLKVAQLETLFQFGLMPDPELIKSPFSFVQLRQQPENGEETRTKTERRYSDKPPFSKFKLLNNFYFVSLRVISCLTNDKEKK